MHHRVPIKFQLGIQASSPIEPRSFAFLSSCKRGVRTPVGFWQETWAFSRGATGESGLPSCCEGIFGIRSSQCRGIRPYFQLRANSVSFRIVAGITGFFSSFNSWDSPPLEVWGGKSGFLSSQSMEIGPHLEMKWGTRGTSLFVGNLGFLLSYNAYLRKSQLQVV